MDFLLGGLSVAEKAADSAALMVDRWAADLVFQPVDMTGDAMVQKLVALTVDEMASMKVDSSADAKVENLDDNMAAMMDAMKVARTGLLKAVLTDSWMAFESVD